MMDRETALDTAGAALDEGLGDRALEALQHLDTDDPERALLALEAHLLRDELKAARRELSRAEAGLPSDHEGLLWSRSEYHLRSWQPDRAAEDLERLGAGGENAALLDRLSLCLELAGDLEGADACLRRAAELDPEGAPLPPRLAEETFDGIVEAAISDLPEVHRDALSRARLITEPVPFAELFDLEDPAETPPDLLGLFLGSTLHELAEDVSGELPPTIYLFQRNLERSCRDEEELREQIRITLFHELGHLLGLDEDEVDAMGLG